MNGQKIGGVERMHVAGQLMQPAVEVRRQTRMPNTRSVRGGERPAIHASRRRGWRLWGGVGSQQSLDLAVPHSAEALIGIYCENGTEGDAQREERVPFRG